MPRGENEAFKKSQGRFARVSKDELRKTASKGGKASSLTMHDFKRMANEIDSEIIKNGDIEQIKHFVEDILFMYKNKNELIGETKKSDLIVKDCIEYFNKTW